MECPLQGRDTDINATCSKNLERCNSNHILTLLPVLKEKMERNLVEDVYGAGLVLIGKTNVAFDTYQEATRGIQHI